MMQWRCKFLGSGTQVYQTLREIRAHRYRMDRDVTVNRAYTIAIDVVSLGIFAFFPPGNDLLADLVKASDCETPEFSKQKFAELCREALPIRPVIRMQGLDKPLTLQPEGSE